MQGTDARRPRVATGNRSAEVCISPRHKDNTRRITANAKMTQAPPSEADEIDVLYVVICVEGNDGTDVQQSLAHPLHLARGGAADGDLALELKR